MSLSGMPPKVQLPRLHPPRLQLPRLQLPRLRLQGVEVLWLNLHLRSPHVTSLGTATERPVVVARIVTEGPDGWGECAALAAPTYSEEYAGGAWSVLRDYLVPILLEATRSDGEVMPEAGALWDLFGSIRGHSMAKACLEMAVLDAGLRSSRRSLADLIGTTRDRVEAGAVVGLATSDSEVGDLCRKVEVLVSEGYPRVKVKIAPGSDVRALGELRRAFPRLAIQADANGAYRLDGPDHLASLERLDDLGLVCIEQPLGAEDLAGHAELASRLKTPVCLDESVWSLARLREAIAARACDMVCIKASRLGGLLRAVRAHDICSDANIAVWCGGMLETALARSANAAIAGLAGFEAPGDLAGGERFEEPDPFLAGAGSDVDRNAGPVVIVHRGPGVGPEPDLQAIDRVTTVRHWAAI